MKIKLFSAVIAIGSLVAGSVNTYAIETHAPNQDIKLSPDLRNLLRAEMREIASGIQGVAMSLATADWKSIQKTSAKIRASYIMENKLTPTQADELNKVLPEQFKRLDAEFHQRAEKLRLAAVERDSELVVFHYSRLLESCGQCHSAYASKQFPGFAIPTSHDHHH